MSTDTGGPAFPFAPNPQRELQDGRWEAPDTYDPGDPGMTLLDHFAGKVASNLKRLKPVNLTKAETRENNQWFAETVYDLGAAMIAEKRRREKGADDERPIPDPHA